MTPKCYNSGMNEEMKLGVDAKYKAEDPDNIPEWIVNEAYLIDEGLDKGAATKQEAAEGLFEDRELLELIRKLVDIKYFVEYPAERFAPGGRGSALTELFTQRFTDNKGQDKLLVDYLAENKQGISLAMSTLDDAT